MQDPILITGCARSGTSLTAGIIYYGGAFGGEMTGATRWNQKGQFENTKIRDKLVKPYLASLGVDPLGQDPLPDPNELPATVGFRKFVEETMENEGYKDGPWFYKGAKMALVWPVWHQSFPAAKWIIVRRNRDEIINSCMRTAFMRAFTDEKGWGWWVDHHLWCFEGMKSAGLDIFEFWPREVIDGKIGHARDMISWLGLNWNESLVTGFIERRLWHG